MDDFEAYYDGPLELRPFLRAWARDRWARLRSFIRYRLLRRPRPVLPPARPMTLTVSSLTDMFKQVYGPESVNDLAVGPSGMHMQFARYRAPAGTSASWPDVTANPRGVAAPIAGLIPDHDDNTGIRCRNSGLVLCVENVLHDCCGWCHDKEEGYRS